MLRKLVREALQRSGLSMAEASRRAGKEPGCGRVNQLLEDDVNRLASLAFISLLSLTACATGPVNAPKGPLPVTSSSQSDDEIDCKNHELLANTDPARALAACLRLAEKNDAAAEFSIGQMHERGQGVSQSDTEAAFWYRQAADQGLPIAESSLGRLFYHGMEGTAPRDFVTAAMWFRKAADQGDVDGQVYLGKMYAQGQGVPIDHVQAYMWYTLAIKDGNSSAKYSRDLIAPIMSPAQITTAEQLAAQWKPNGS